MLSNLFAKPAVYENGEKYYAAVQTTDDNTAHTRCMLDI